MYIDPLKCTQTSIEAFKLLNLFEQLRVLDQEMPAQLISCFLYIASHNPCHKQAIEQDLNLTVASGSRNIDRLCNVNRLEQPGLGLVQKEHDPSNKRRLLISLTPKGEALIRNLKTAVYN
jgi:DNA-binding MarR family transcriptional regulator